MGPYNIRCRSTIFLMFTRESAYFLARFSQYGAEISAVIQHTSIYTRFIQERTDPARRVSLSCAQRAFSRCYFSF